MADKVKIDVEAMEKIMSGTEQAANDLRDVLKSLRTPFTGLVPDKWEGAAATAFQGDMEAVLGAMEKLQQTLEKTPDTIKRMTARLAEGHKQGQQAVRKAGQDFGAAGGGSANP